MIGQAGLTMQPYKNGEVPEIGYLLKKAFCNRGYAREAAKACKNYIFRKLRVCLNFLTKLFNSLFQFMVISGLQQIAVPI